VRDKVFWRDLGVCLALVNLIYLDVWRLILALDASAAYYLPDGSLSLGFFLWPVGMVVGLALLLFTAGRVVRRKRHARLEAVARLALLLLTFCALNAVRHLFPQLTAESVARALGRPTFILLTLGTASLAVFIGLRYLRAVARGASTLLLLTLPFFPVNLATTVGRVIAHRSLANKSFPPQTCRTSNRLPRSPQPRVIIIVFDELDQRYLSPSSSLAVKLPALESLRDVALWSESATAPDNKTITSMPALISGVAIKDARPLRPDELEIELEDGRVARWSEEPNLFQKACSLELDSALVGWYHPYCRILGADLSYCASYAYTPQPKADFVPQLVHQGILLGQTLPGVAALRLADRLNVPLDPLVSTPPAGIIRRRTAPASATTSMWSTYAKRIWPPSKVCGRGHRAAPTTWATAMGSPWTRSSPAPYGLQAQPLLGITRRVGPAMPRAWSPIPVWLGMS
jgi:hypothetical protein